VWRGDIDRAQSGRARQKRADSTRPSRSGLRVQTHVLEDSPRSSTEPEHCDTFRALARNESAPAMGWWRRECPETPGPAAADQCRPDGRPSHGPPGDVAPRCVNQHGFEPARGWSRLALAKRVTPSKNRIDAGVPRKKKKKNRRIFRRQVSAVDAEKILGHGGPMCVVRRPGAPHHFRAPND